MILGTFPIPYSYKPAKSYVEDLEAGNIEHTNEHGTLHAGLQGLVTLFHDPLEEAIEHALGQSANGVIDLGDIPTLGDELSTDLDLGLAQIPV